MANILQAKRGENWVCTFVNTVMSSNIPPFATNENQSSHNLFWALTQLDRGKVTPGASFKDSAISWLSWLDTTLRT
ncbi:hypothetical protein BDV33DRAFT_185116, partial [Aspergillus novoparasiticus]